VEVVVYRWTILESCQLGNIVIKTNKYCMQNAKLFSESLCMIDFGVCLRCCTENVYDALLYLITDFAGQPALQKLTFKKCVYCVERDLIG
jgi:hypothetical protein